MSKYEDGVRWLAEMERVHERSVDTLQFSAAVILLGHLFGVDQKEVARQVLETRRDPSRTFSVALPPLRAGRRRGGSSTRSSTGRSTGSCQTEAGTREEQT